MKKMKNEKRAKLLKFANALIQTQLGKNQIKTCQLILKGNEIMVKAVEKSDIDVSNVRSVMKNFEDVIFVSATSTKHIPQSFQLCQDANWDFCHQIRQKSQYTQRIR